MPNHALTNHRVHHQAVARNPWQEAAEHWEVAAGSNSENAGTYKEQARVCRGIAGMAEDARRYRARLREMILQEVPYSRAKELARQDIYGL